MQSGQAFPGSWPRIQEVEIKAHTRVGSSATGNENTPDVSSGTMDADTHGSNYYLCLSFIGCREGL